jgi:DNA-binding LytR/AlgR family response regulator
MALFYALFEKLVLKEKSFFLDLVKISAQNTALVLLIPYSTIWLFFSWREKKIQLDNLSQGQQLTDSSKNMVPFHDEKGVLRISIKMENLLFLEASDNYVNIHYLNKEKVSRFMLRNSLKRLEEELRNTELIRCHRSYMVNFEKIKIIRKEKDGLVLEFDLPFATDIPVSKTYVENVMATFARFSNT